jgi:hypothetical protein
MALHRMLTAFEKPLSHSLVKVSAVVLFAVSFFIQVQGVHALFVKKWGTQAIVDSVKALNNDIVVTDVYWLPEEMASIYFQKKILMVDSDEALSALLTRLREKDVQTFTFVGSEFYPSLSNQGLRQLAPLVQSTRQVKSPGMDFMSVLMFSCRL